MINYFERYPLITTNSIDIKTFKRILLFLEKDYHKLSSDINKSNNNKYKKRIDNLIQIFKKRFDR
jgi:hypothetical protein